MAHPNAELLRKGYDAFEKGDVDALRELMDPDIVYHWPGSGPLAGDYRGLNTVLEFFGRVNELAQGTLTQEIHAILADDEHAVALVSARAERNGKTLDEKSIDVFHIRNVKVTEAWGFLEDTAVDAEFWS